MNSSANVLTLGNLTKNFVPQVHKRSQVVSAEAKCFYRAFLFLHHPFMD